MKFLLLFLLLSCVILYAQERDPLALDAAKKIHRGIYKEIQLYDFSKNPTGKILASRNYQIIFRKSNFYPAPILDSSYWEVRFYGNGPGQGQYRFKKPIEIYQHIRFLYIWVYGMHLPTTVHFLIEDTYGRIHLLKIGNLKFRGWRKLKVEVPDAIVQRDWSLGVQKTLKIIGLSIRTGSPAPLKSARFFFIDNLSAYVRDKYKSPQKN
ncbi:MAG: hypothetical protein D6767_09910 [Candidatus Hydrogenedentota bacterium]|nr:MAG: hypothetical protein D6767_09910 [Candidatus Hydrogenedentota bacterium]